MAESIVESSTEAVLNVAKTERIRVLHVDDDPAFLKVAKQCLDAQGEFEVDTASSVNEALEKLEKTDYDAVVSDYQMPDEDGLEFLKELRANGNTVPFIVFTGKGREEIAVEALNLGADRYLDKHGDPETVYCELAHDIRAALRSKRAEDAKRRSEERYRTLLESISDSVYVLDREWRHAVVNEAAADFTRIPREKLLGNKLTDLFPGVEKTPFFAAFKRVMETRKPETVDGKYVFEDGREGWYEVRVYPVPEGILCMSTDITSRKKTEEELEVNEEKLRDVFACSPDAITVIDLNGNIVECNQETLDMLGYSSKDELIGRNGFTLVSEKDRERAKGNLTKVLDHGSMRNIEYVALTKDGTEFSAELSVCVVKDSSGNPMGFVSMIKDISERKKAEEALRGSEEKYRNLVENSQDGIAIVDFKGNVLFANKAAERLTGYTLKEGKGLNIRVVTPKRYWPKSVEMLLKARMGKPIPCFEYELKRKDGTTVPVETGGQTIFEDGKPVAIQITTRETTERKKAEEQLRTNTLILENITDSIIVTDPEGRITSWNEGASKVFGFSAEEMLGENIAKVSKPKEREQVAPAQLEQVRKGVLFLGEWEGVRKDGEPVWLMLTTKLLKNSQGETVGMIGVGKDLTERKKAEEALRKSEEKWRSLAENAPNVIVIVDRVGTIQFINRTVVNARPEEIVGRSVYDFIDPEHHNVVKKTIEQVFQTGEGSRYGISGVGPKGSVAWYETHAGPIKHDGQTVAVTLITTDLTERRKVEQQLRIKETAVASSINGVAFADPEGKLTYVNSSFLEMWGYANENEVLGRPAEDFWSSRENAGEVVKALMHKGGWVGDLTAKKKDGSTFEVQLSASTVKDETGKPSCMMGSFLDVTERRKAGQSLKESEEKYRSLVELAPDGIVAVNAEGVVTSANRSFLTLVGYDSEREIVGKPFTELMTMRKEDIPRFQGMFMSLMKGESPSPSEFLYVRRDGASRWAEVHPGLLIKDGHPVGVQAIMRDVSERKKTEEKLRNSEERLSTLFELAPDAYYLSDLKGNFVDGNKAAEKLTGYMKDELIGKSFMKLKLLPRNEVLKAAKLLAMNALGKSTGPDELVLNRKDGTQVPVEIRTHPIRIKGKTLVLGIARDITTRKKNERAIQESQQRFEGLFRHNPEAAVYLGPDLCIQGINPRFEKLFGYALPEIKGKHIDDVVVPNDKREEAQALDSQAIQGYAHQNTWRRRKNGSPVPVSISAAPIIIEDRLAGYIGIYSDISELRSTQKELEATNEKLRVVGGLTRHDVRNKLSAITGNAYLLKKQLADNKESLDKVRDMETAVSQVTRIFDFAKNYEMLGAEELTYIDVQKSVNEAVQLFQDLKGVRVLNECHGLTVLSDSLLRQLFYNLIDNSLKYGEKLSQIRIHYEKAEGNQLRLVYEDDGVGISQDAKPKLFDEGYTTGKGSGYGLYLIRRIMEVYGWTIQETGAPGKGARFTMVMPERNQNGKENYQLH